MSSPIEDRLATALYERAVKCERQRTFLGYKLDFAIALPGAFFLAVECDGHDYHSTPQQASYDRARDRELLRRGVVTLRFTGRDICRDVDQCADEVIACMDAIVGRQRALQKRPMALAAPEPIP